MFMLMFFWLGTLFIEAVLIFPPASHSWLILPVLLGFLPLGFWLVRHTFLKDSGTALLLGTPVAGLAAVAPIAYLPVFFPTSAFF